MSDRYDKMTQLMTETQPKIADAVMDAAIFAYADHKRQPRDEGAKEGEGFGQKMYDAVSEALLDAKYGVKREDLASIEDPNFKKDFERYMIAQQIGVTSKGLEKQYKDKKALAPSDLDGVRRTIGNTLGRAQDYDVNGEVEDLTQDDVEAYATRLTAMAGELNLGEDKIPRLRTIEECLTFHKKIAGAIREMQSLEDRL